MVDTTLLQARRKPFSLVHTGIDENDPYTPSKILLYESDTITSTITTLSEIFRLCTDELIILKYRHRTQRINGDPVNHFEYRLRVMFPEQFNETTDYGEIKNIYSIKLNEHYNSLEEIKYFQQQDTTITGPYIIQLKINLHVLIHYPEEFQPFDDDEESIRSRMQQPIVTKQAIEEDQCVVCYCNPTNVLYSDCCHLVVCKDCDEAGDLITCPMCRTPITLKYII